MTGTVTTYRCSICTGVWTWRNTPAGQAARDIVGRRHPLTEVSSSSETRLHSTDDQP